MKKPLVCCSGQMESTVMKKLYAFESRADCRLVHATSL